MQIFGVQGVNPAADINGQFMKGYSAPLGQWTSYQLIDLINNHRVAYGLPALIIDPILMQTAQATADYMAVNRMHGHIGDVRGRVRAAGYGAGDIPWATENYVVVPEGGEDMIMIAWADDLHMKPVVDSNYKHVGAGVSPVDGQVYYILHAAYTSNGIYKPGETSYSASSSTSNSSTTSDSTSSDESSGVDIMSQYIYAVETVTPSAGGRLVHTVRPGQSLWSIAIAYNTHIVDIVELNGLEKEDPLIWDGQELMIPFDKKQATLAALQATDEVKKSFENTLTSSPVQTMTPQANITSTMISQNTQPAQHDQIGAGILAMAAIGFILILVGLMMGNRQ